MSDQADEQATTDATQGLEAADTATLSARVDAFNEHGDAQRAINENPPPLGPQSAGSDAGFTLSESEAGTDEGGESEGSQPS